MAASHLRRKDITWRQGFSWFSRMWLVAIPTSLFLSSGIPRVEQRLRVLLLMSRGLVLIPSGKSALERKRRFRVRLRAFSRKWSKRTIISSSLRLTGRLTSTWRCLEGFATTWLGSTRLLAMSRAFRYLRTTRTRTES